MANQEFRNSLKKLRTDFKLTQTQLSLIAGIKQTEYSAFESGKKKLELDDAEKLSSKIWGSNYKSFVDFSNGDIVVENLPLETQEIIALSLDTILKDETNLLANELTRLITEGKFSKPITAKIILSLMDVSLENRKSTEVTGLLGREKRNQYIYKLDNKIGREIVFIHKDFFDQFKHLSSEELKELIEKLYPKKEDKEATDGAGKE